GAAGAVAAGRRMRAPGARRRDGAHVERRDALAQARHALAAADGPRTFRGGGLPRLVVEEAPDRGARLLARHGAAAPRARARRRTHPEAAEPELGRAP